MNIRALAERRARCAAELETLSGLAPQGDPEENAAHLRAVALARAAYKQSEWDYANAAATFTAAEIRALGIPHA